MPSITIPNTFVANTVISPSQMNANFTAVTAVVNGALDNTNIAAGAGIVLTKLALAPGAAAFDKVSSGGLTWGSGLTTDTIPRVSMSSDLGIQFGPGGAGALEVTLLRSASNTLQLALVGGGAASFDLNGGAALNFASIALKNTNSATITPAAMGAARAVTFPDPGGAAKLYCGASGLANHQVVTFDGSIFQGVAPGTAGKQLLSDGTNWVASAPYQSADQTITTAGALTLAHGLGRVPLNVWFALVNVSPEGNYTVGQVVYSFEAVPGANSGVSVIVDATNLTLRFGSDATVFNLPDATSGADTALTNNKWALRVFAS